MMRRMLLLVLAICAGCTAGKDPSEPVECEPWPADGRVKPGHTYCVTIKPERADGR